MISSPFLFPRQAWRAGLAGLFFAALPVAAEAQTTALAPAEYLSLDGKTVADGNPLEGNAVKIFNAPVLLLYRCPASSPKGLVLLCPGGGYRWLDMKNEGENTAQFLNAQGYDVAILEYHVMTSAEVRDLADPSLGRRHRSSPWRMR